MHRAHKITSLFHGTADSGIGRITAFARLEDSKGTPGNSFRTLGSFALVYVYDGAGVYRDQNQTIKIRSGDLIIITPDLVHAYKPDPDQCWNELFILFEGEIFNVWKKRGLFDVSCPVINLQPVQRWKELFSDICQTDAEPLKQVCRLQFFLADALLQGGGMDEKEEAARQWIHQANRLLTEHLADSDPVRRAARAIGISYEGFRKKYRRLSGVSPGRHCSEQMMALAAKRMVETNQPLRVIAEEFGFCDEFHFSRRFKQITGVAPTVYRNRLP
jgi:AraC-like DNA-binding protein